MTPAEAADFLAGERRAHLATIDPDGTPHIVPLSYVVIGGQLTFWTDPGSRKVANIRRDPRITCLVETGTEYFELAGVSIQGTAEIVRDEDRIREIGTKVVHAMAGGADLGELGAEIVEKQVKKRVGIVVTPTKTASWDHSKMSSLPGGGEKP